MSEVRRGLLGRALKECQGMTREGLYLADSSFRIIDWNSALEEILGISGDEILLRRPWDLYLKMHSKVVGWQRELTYAEQARLNELAIAGVLTSAKAEIPVNLDDHPDPARRGMWMLDVEARKWDIPDEGTHYYFARFSAIHIPRLLHDEELVSLYQNTPPAEFREVVLRWVSEDVRRLSLAVLPQICRHQAGLPPPERDDACVPHEGTAGHSRLRRHVEMAVRAPTTRSVQVQDAASADRPAPLVAPRVWTNDAARLGASLGAQGRLSPARLSRRRIVVIDRGDFSADRVGEVWLNGCRVSRQRLSALQYRILFHVLKHHHLRGTRSTACLARHCWRESGSQVELIERGAAVNEGKYARVVSQVNRLLKEAFGVILTRQRVREYQLSAFVGFLVVELPPAELPPSTP